MGDNCQISQSDHATTDCRSLTTSILANSAKTTINLLCKNQEAE